MAIPAKELRVFESLQTDKLEMVLNYASSLIRNRSEHTEAYYQFQEARKRMLAKNPMTGNEIDMVIHSGADK